MRIVRSVSGFISSSAGVPVNGISLYDMPATCSFHMMPVLTDRAAIFYDQMIRLYFIFVYNIMIHDIIENNLGLFSMQGS